MSEDRLSCMQMDSSVLLRSCRKLRIVLAVATRHITKCWLQDAPETIEKVLRSEQDLSTKRNAFAMLAAHAQDRATHYLFDHLEQVATWGDILQMAVLELIRKVSQEHDELCFRHVHLTQ